MPHDDVEPNVLRERLANGEDLYLLDVREPFEVVEWAFPDAVNIPIGQLGDRTDELPTETTIVAICHSGVRSASAADALNNAGWHAENLAGGVVAWIAATEA